MADETQTPDSPEAPEGEAAAGAEMNAATEGLDSIRTADFSADEDAELPDHADPWSPPPTDERGVARDADGLPLNLRLRALELADGGKEEDPSGAVTPEAIAEAGEALAAYDERYPLISSASTKKELEAIAEDENIDLSAATNNEERASAILRARPTRII